MGYDHQAVMMLWNCIAMHQQLVNHHQPPWKPANQCDILFGHLLSHFRTMIDHYYIICLSMIYILFPITAGKTVCRSLFANPFLPRFNRSSWSTAIVGNKQPSQWFNIMVPQQQWLSTINPIINPCFQPSLSTITSHDYTNYPQLLLSILNRLLLHHDTGWHVGWCLQGQPAASATAPRILSAEAGGGCWCSCCWWGWMKNCIHWVV